MKKRLLKLLTIAGVTLMLSGMITGCRDKSAPASTPTETADNNTENDTQASTEASEITESTQSTEASSETETTEQTNTDSTTATPVKDVHSDFEQTLSDINAIQAGSAGCSLRSEEAFSTFTEFVNTYGADNSSDAITTMTKEWLDNQKNDNPYIYDDFMENFDSLLALAEDADTEFTGSDAYKHVSEGILKALEQ